MDARTKHKFSKWVEWAVKQSNGEGCFPRKIVLRRMQADGGSVALTSRAFKKDPDTDQWDCTPISETDLAYNFLEPLFETVLEDANGWELPNKYCLELHLEFGEPHISFPLIVRGENHTNMQASEPANATGVLAQVMRQNEFLSRGMGAMVTQLSDMLEKMAARQMQHDERRMQMFAALEEAETRRHDRDLERKKAEQEDARKERMLAMALPMIPVVANKLLGKPALQETHNPKVEAIRAAFREMSPEDINRLMAALPPEKFLVLASLFEEVMKDDEAASAASAANRGNGRPSS